MEGWHFGVSLGDDGERGGLRGIGYRACGVSPVEKNAGGKGCVGWSAVVFRVSRADRNAGSRPCTWSLTV